MSENIPIYPEGEIEITSENKCGYCDGTKCCTYITQQIDTPRSKADFDVLLWQVSHRSVRVYQDEDGWFLLIDTPCLHLEPDGACGIYETRPQICREYSNDYCEFDAPAEGGFKRYFDSYDSLLAYCRKRFKRWD
ncbi:MAG TPA: YkgJ family cysteine cluster protein [Gammaproteobacteria bacterium]|nr:YkgJ family cysteine cluster protein [Gammaproteobacteria bacterium]